MNNLERIVEAAAGMGAALVLETLGISAGEISQRQARKVYGKWFTDAEAAGRIRPSRIDQGRNGTRHYRVAAIPQLRTADLVRAELQANHKTGVGRTSSLHSGPVEQRRSAAFMQQTPAARPSFTTKKAI